MWNTSVKIEYIAGLIVDALENYSVNRENAQFRLVIEELRNHFTNCSEEEITDIISLCMKMYSSKKIEHAELVLTSCVFTNTPSANCFCIFTASSSNVDISS